MNRVLAIKSIFAALVVLAAAAPAPASAQGRLSTTNLTCAQVRGMVAQQGAIVLGTGGATYQRLVRDTSFCQRLETAQTVYAPTRDTPQCPVGNACREMELDLYHD